MTGVLILAGPTASGKTDLAIALARRFEAEVVGADSRQIYRDMPIGTAAPTEAERAGVPYHLVGFLEPHERYSAALFVRDALAAIARVAAAGRRAIVAGGTGFYLRALSGDVALAGARDEGLRARLAREALLHPSEVMHDWLRALDPARAESLRAGDRYRVARALEIALAEREGRSASPAPQHATLTLRAAGIPFRKTYLAIGVAELGARIEARVDRMLASGFLEEAERVGAGAVAADAVGYRNALAHLRGQSTRAELRAQLIRNTRRYAKRQATWFRTEPEIERIDAAHAFEELERIALALPGWK